MTLKSPDDTQRQVIVGRTGTGKTQFGLFALQGRSYHRMPWMLLDFKRDPTIAKIPQIEELSVTDKIPTRAGLYVVRPLPGDADDGLVTDWFMKIWAKENTGIFVDELYGVGRFDRGLRAVLTQGRSKHIPVIALSQRPAWISPFMFSEAEFKVVFSLDSPADHKTMRDWIPGADVESLKDFHSIYYHSPSRKMAYLNPCPNEDEILNRFDMKRPQRPWWWWL